MISATAKEDQRLWIAVGFSFLLHAALLAVKFAPPTNQTSKPLSSGLEIILVNARHDKAPVNADALAQANLSGGGNTELGRARSPLPNLQQSVDGNHIETQRRKIAELEQQQERMLSQLSTLSKERIKVAEKSIKKSVDVSTKPETMDTVALARREAEIAKQVSDYNKRPIKSQLTPSTREVSYAVYYATLQKQIERTGTRYFPQQEGKKMYGDLVIEQFLFIVFLSYNAFGYLGFVNEETNLMAVIHSQIEDLTIIKADGLIVLLSKFLFSDDFRWMAISAPPTILPFPATKLLVLSPGLDPK